MTLFDLLFLLILLMVMYVSVKKEKLTVAGSLTGGVIACCIYLGAGYTGIAMLGLFFILGSFATSWKINVKEKLGAAEKNRGRRQASQVIANGGVAGLAGLLSWLYKDQQFYFQLMLAGALAAATADTVSSELGTLYGKRFYNIISMRPDKRGENGIVSLEGFLLGLLGSTLIALVYSISFGWSNHIAWIIIAGTAGNIADSVLGATLERKQYLNNNAVNLLNTMVGALVVWVLYRLLP